MVELFYPEVLKKDLDFSGDCCSRNLVDTTINARSSSVIRAVKEVLSVAISVALSFNRKAIARIVVCEKILLIFSKKLKIIAFNLINPEVVVK